MTIGTYDPETNAFRFPHGGSEIVIPLLTGVVLAEWTARYGAAVVALIEGLERSASEIKLGEFVRSVGEHQSAVADLLVAYETTGVLGGRQHFRRTWTLREAAALFELIVDTHARQ